MPNAIAARRKVYYKNNARFYSNDEISDEENEELVRELEQLTDDDLEIVRSEMIFI